MTYKEKDTARGRFLLAFTKHDPGAAFRWVQCDKPELSPIRNGSADVELTGEQNIHAGIQLNSAAICTRS